MYIYILYVKILKKGMQKLYTSHNNIETIIKCIDKNSCIQFYSIYADKGIFCGINYIHNLMPVKKRFSKD